MGQVLRADYVPALVKTGALQIKLPSGSFVTLGGQQYYISADKYLTLSGLTANTLYFVYVKLDSQTPTLYYSTSLPSAYKATYPKSQLIGAFYSNGLASVEFGSFVNVEGAPVTDWTSYTPTLTGLTLGNGSLEGKWRRVGDSAHIRIKHNFGTTGTSSSGFSWSLPTGLRADSAKMPTNSTGYRYGTHSFWYDASAGIFKDIAGIVLMADLYNIQASISGTSGQLASTDIPSGQTDTVNIEVTIPISGWSSSTLKFL